MEMLTLLVQVAVLALLSSRPGQLPRAVDSEYISDSFSTRMLLNWGESSSGGGGDWKSKLYF